MKMIDYRIDWLSAGMPFPMWVRGYAVKSSLPVRFCVRFVSGRGWIADHYDSGRFFGGYKATRAHCVTQAEKILTRVLASGEYAKKIRALNRERSK